MELRLLGPRRDAVCSKLSAFNSPCGSTRKSSKRNPVRIALVREMHAIDAEISALKVKRERLQPFEPILELKIRVRKAEAEVERLARANADMAGLASRGIEADKLIMENNRLSARCGSLERMVERLQEQLAAAREG